MGKKRIKFWEENPSSEPRKEDWINRFHEVKVNDRCSVPYVIPVPERVSPCPSLDYYDQEGAGFYQGIKRKPYISDCIARETCRPRYSLYDILE